MRARSRTSSALPPSRAKTSRHPIGLDSDRRGQRSRSQSVSEQRRALLLPQEVKELGRRAGDHLLRGPAARSGAGRSATSRTSDFEGVSCPRRAARCPLDGRRRCLVRSALPRPSPLSRKSGSRARARPRRVEKESIVIREATVEDIERIESLTLEDFATDFSKVPIPDGEGPISEPEMKTAVDTFLNSLERG